MKTSKTILKDILVIVLIIFFVCAYSELGKYNDIAFSSEYSRTNMYDNHGRYTGYIDGDNVIYDDHGRYIGKAVEEDLSYEYKNYGETTGDPDYDPLTE